MGPVTKPISLFVKLFAIPKFRLSITYLAFLGLRTPGDESSHLAICIN